MKSFMSIFILLFSGFSSFLYKAQPNRNPMLSPSPSVIANASPLSSSSPMTDSMDRRRRRTPSPTPKPSAVGSVTLTPKVTATPLPSQTPTPTLTPTLAPSATPRPVQAKLLWGAEFPDWDPAAIAPFEQKVGKPINIYATFVHWGNEKDFPLFYADTVAKKGKTLLIYWEAKDYNIDSPLQSQFNFDSILGGNWDAYFIQFAKDAKTYAGPVILAPFNEANDNSGPWGGLINGNTTDKFIKAFRYVRGFFKDVPNVKFAWTMNNVSSPQTDANKVERYYPGADGTDYIGVDGFNFGNPWQTWDQVFGPVLTTLSQYNKPIIIASTASAQGTSKPQWITDGFGTQVKKYPLIMGWVWFNEQKEQDWRIDSDTATLNAFKLVLP